MNFFVLRRRKRGASHAIDGDGNRLIGGGGGGGSGGGGGGGGDAQHTTRSLVHQHEGAVDDGADVERSCSPQNTEGSGSLRNNAAKRIDFNEVMSFINEQIEKMIEDGKMAVDVVVGPEVTKQTRKQIEDNLVGRGFGVLGRLSIHYPALYIWHIRRAAVYTFGEYK